jgi:myosin-crossreactive antigen
LHIHGWITGKIMGYSVQVQSSNPTQASSGKTSGTPTISSDLKGVNGVITNSATSGQPNVGAPNTYSNTVGQWDNTVQQPQQPKLGKGKGA